MNETKRPLIFLIITVIGIVLIAFIASNRYPPENAVTEVCDCRM